eukprot:5723038-Alexandrium_andersonii.AAC.1
MSASLVGSEMCIRDSTGVPRLVGPGKAGNVDTTTPVVLQQLFTFKDHETVSYTHLTLPTICSV